MWTTSADLFRLNAKVQRGKDARGRILECGGKSDATPLFGCGQNFQSGVALRFPPQSKIFCRLNCFGLGVFALNSDRFLPSTFETSGSTGGGLKADRLRGGAATSENFRLRLDCHWHKGGNKARYY